MANEVWTTLQAWLLALLLYPGLLFGLLLLLVGEWTTAALWSLLRRMPRPQSRQRPFTYPLTNALKLAGRSRSAGLPSPAAMSGSSFEGTRAYGVPLQFLCVIGPLLSLALLPYPGSSLAGQTPTGDLLLVLLLLVVQPLATAVWRLLTGGLTSLRGAQDVGRVLTGLLPALVSIAALVEVSGKHTLMFSGLTAAPETAAQTFVRLLAGAVLLLSLSWWAISSRDMSLANKSAGVYLGRLLQTAALAAFWSLLVLPAPGDRIWAIPAALLGAIFAYICIRSFERVSPASREKDAASLTWAAALPVSTLALVLAVLWPGV